MHRIINDDQLTWLPGESASRVGGDFMPAGLGICAAAQDCCTWLPGEGASRARGERERESCARAGKKPRPRRPASSTRRSACVPLSAMHAGSRGGMLKLGPSDRQPAAASPACARLAVFDRVGMPPPCPHHAKCHPARSGGGSSIPEEEGMVTQPRAERSKHMHGFLTGVAEDLVNFC